jgi:hypothetical protein
MSSKWVKPNGKVMEINDNAIEYVKSLGWVKHVKALKKKASKKKTVKKKG